jgi:acetyltransferase-like isoleucine patch superfamily enzyme
MHKELEKIVSVRELIFLSLSNHLPRLQIFDRIRHILIRLAGMKINGRCLIRGPLIIRPIGGCKNIAIGEGSFFNTNIRFGCPSEEIRIGSHVQIGACVCFESVGHTMACENGTIRGAIVKPIVVDDYVWIGTGCIILQGVTIGRGSIVAAGSVVNTDIEPDCV